MSSFAFPHNVLHKMAEPQWAAGTMEEKDSSVDALAREEAVFAAKTRAVAEIKAATPFGSTPAILARHQRRMQDLAALEKTRSTKAAPVPFWNRTHSTNRFSRPSSPERVEEEYQLDTPQSSSNPNRSLMSDFS